MSTSLPEDLRDFSTRLLEQTGGLVEWGEESASGTAVVTAEVAQRLRLPESFSLVMPPQEGGLCLSLATDFLDQAAHLLDLYVPRVAQFQVGERYLKRGDLQQAIDDAFGWQNARVRVQGSRAELVEYHTWWYAVSLRSDDVWDDRLALTLNSQSLAEVTFPDPFELYDAHPVPAEPGLGASQVDTSVRSQEIAQQRLLRAATNFLERTQSHRQRDQKRLRDYYHALLRETRAGSKRTKTIPTPEESAAKERAVDLELRRKLAELDERYAMEAALRPIVVIRTRVPTLAVDLTVQRKQAVRNYTVFWNSLTKSFEPIPCSRCLASTFNLWFTNDSVEPLCRACDRSPALGETRVRSV